MKRIVNFVAAIVLLCAAVSCMEEAVEPGLVVGQNEAEKVFFTVDDFESSEPTRTAITTGNAFQWAADDVVGIFPSSGYQAAFPMSSGAGSDYAVFDGGGWGLKRDAAYYAYYPFALENFESEDMREHVKYSYDGQEACFADENGLINLGKYDFMASGASKFENGGVNFNFKHLGALCRITYEAPATVTYSKIIIEAEEAIFPVNGHFDATDKDGDGVIELESDTEKKSSFEVLFPQNHNSFDKGDKVEMYFMMPPVDLSGKSLKIKLVDAAYDFYETVFPGKTILAGKAYPWEILIDKYEAPLGQETSNCYIISETGSYTFPTVKGNSVYYVGEVASAEVLWETFGTDVAPSVGDLIAKVSYADNKITFSTSDIFREGNALIAAKDADGNILWSWHIWLTDKPKDQAYRNNAGTMMDRNLGATSATPGDVGALGLLYQWGRKDPFLGSSSISSSTRSKSTLSSWPTATSTESKGTIAYATSHPTTFIKYNSNNYDWWYSSESGVTDDTRWTSTKTMYDPCPVGYRVPDGGPAGVWATAFGSSGSYPDYDATSEGYNLGKSDAGRYLTDETTCWYPAAGYLYYSIGSLHSTGDDGSYWSCTPNGSKAYYLFFYNIGSVLPSDSNYRAFGQSVRCLRE